MDTGKDRVGKYTPTAALGPFVGDGLSFPVPPVGLVHVKNPVPALNLQGPKGP